MAGNRREKLLESFYSIFPNIEHEDKLFVANERHRKSSDFKVNYLRDFIHSEFYELSGLERMLNDPYIRFKRSCRFDLKRWKTKSGKRSQRPYFKSYKNRIIGHRQRFVNYFLSGRDHYLLTDIDTPDWIIQVKIPVS